MSNTKSIEGLMDLVSEFESKAESAGHPLGNSMRIAPLRIEIKDYAEALIADTRAQAFADGRFSEEEVSEHRRADDKARIAELEAELAAQGAATPRFKTSEAGRAGVKQFFNDKLQRHDFNEYIEKHLAADFACTLADGLAAQGAEPVGYCEQKALDHATNLGPGEATFVLVAAESEKVWSVPIYTRPPAAVGVRGLTFRQALNAAIGAAQGAKGGV